MADDERKRKKDYDPDLNRKINKRTDLSPPLQQTADNSQLPVNITASLLSKVNYISSTNLFH